MYWRILKKDLKRNKTMNLIFFAFMILCALLLCSSGANVVISYNVVNYFLDISKIADQNYFASSYYDEEFDDWLSSSPYVEKFEKYSYVLLDKEDIVFKGENLTPAQGIAHLYLFTTAGSEYSLVFDENDKGVDCVASGEVAMSTNIAKNLGLKKGDSFDIRIGNEMRSLKLTTLLKDAVSGKENICFIRIFLSPQDYDDLSDNNQNKMTEWSVMASDIENLRMDYNGEYTPISFEHSRDTISMMFITETISSFILVMAATMILIMALVLLNFAIRLTIQEDFPEIGVMKAIGIQNTSIRRMYMTKYLVLSVFATGIGLSLSWLFGDLFMASLKESMVMPAHFGLWQIPGGLIIRLLFAIVMVGFTMLFCWKATQPMAKMPAIQAIREGDSGERFRHKGIMRLGASQIKLVFFLASNDVMARLRSFVPLFLVLAFGMLLIILPANIASTLGSGKSLEFCGFSRTDAYSDSVAKMVSIRFREKAYEELKAALRDMEQIFSDKSIRVEVDANITISSRIYKDNQRSAISILGFKRISESPMDVTYFAGNAPRLADEIALTDVLMKKLDVQLGDTVILDIGQEKKRYIITGQIQAICNNGHIIIFSSFDEPGFLYASTLQIALINFIDRDNIPGQMRRAKEAFPEYNIVSDEELMKNLFGETIDSLNSLVVVLLFCLSLIICLVVYLISYAFLIKDKSAIVLLRSIGLTNNTIRLWQTLRIMMVSLAGILFGIALSFILNPLVTKIAFGAAGANKFTSQYDVFWTFILYPALIGISVLCGTLFATLGIHKISMRNNNNH